MFLQDSNVNNEFGFFTANPTSPHFFSRNDHQVVSACCDRKVPISFATSCHFPLRQLPANFLDYPCQLLPWLSISSALLPLSQSFFTDKHIGVCTVPVYSGMLSTGALTNGRHDFCLENVALVHLYLFKSLLCFFASHWKRNITLQNLVQRFQGGRRWHL